MTRINAGIKPQNLCDQHLLAELREITRVRHTQDSDSKAPTEFVLGSGHVLFFKDKLGFIFERYCLLFNEAKRRGFNVNALHDIFVGYDLSGKWVPTKQSKGLLLDRITTRLHSMSNIRYMGKDISVAEALNILYYGKFPARVFRQSV